MPMGSFQQPGGLQGYQTGPRPRDFAGDQAAGFDPSGMGDLMQWMLNRKPPITNTAANQNWGPRGMGSIGDPNKLDRMLAEKAQLRSQHMAQPTKRVQGPGIIMGQTPDTLGMSGAQRQAFLPQNAMGGSMFGDVSGPEAGGPGMAMAPQNPEDQARAFQAQQLAQALMAQRMYGGGIRMPRGK